MKRLSTVKPRGSFRKELLFSLTFILCLSTIVQAEISIRDNWDTDGRLLLRGVGWEAEFRRGQGWLAISSNKKVSKILPFDSEQKNSQRTVSCKVVQDNKNRQIEIRALFSTGQEQIRGNFLFDLDGTVEVKPSQNMEGVSILSKIRYGILPSVILDDIVYDPQKYLPATELRIPSENLFMGLLEGQDSVLVCAWPSNSQKVKLLLENAGKEQRLIEAIVIQLEGKSAFLRPISRPGIWHTEKLLPSYLAKDTEIGWKRPFGAKWKTHLREINDIMTAFSFRNKRSKPWRPRIGWYIYPVWFEGQRTMFHLSKKIPPVGEVLIYALEGHRDTPAEFARKHLGSISNLKPKQKLRRYPENNAGLRNCDGRDRVKKIFKAGLQVKNKKFLKKVMADFLYSINMDARRLEEYENFIPRMNKKIDSWRKKEKDNPKLRSFLDQMKNNVNKMDRQYHSRMGGKTASEYLRHETEAINKVKDLIEEEGLEVYPNACSLLDQIRLWSRMEDVPASVGALAREWARQAGYGCVQNIAAVEYAEEMRRDIREFIGTGATYETIY